MIRILFFFAVFLSFAGNAAAEDWYCGGVPWQITKIPHGYALDHGNRAIYCTNIRYDEQNQLRDYGDEFECTGAGYSKLRIIETIQQISVEYLDTGKKTILTVCPD